jgi:SNF2 family DNA or RNA helicase
LRIACSGGKIPLSDDCEAGEDDNSEEKSSERKKRGKRGQAKEVAAKPKKAKKVTTYSEFRFQSKFNVLIEELKSIRDKEPECKLAIEVASGFDGSDSLVANLPVATAKSLVFSQYASSLKFLQEELPNHGFQFRTLSGDMTLKQRADSLHSFQHDPPTTVFLLSMR